MRTFFPSNVGAVLGAAAVFKHSLSRANTTHHGDIYDT